MKEAEIIKNGNLNLNNLGLTPKATTITIAMAGKSMEECLLEIFLEHGNEPVIKVQKHRHKKGQLSLRKIEELLTKFGYVKVQEVKYEKK